MRTAPPSARTSTARSSASRRSTRSRSRRRSARTSRSASTSPCRRMRRAAPRSLDATERTHRWAERCLAAHARPDQALFGIIQGGLEADLRADSTRILAALPVRRAVHRRPRRRRDTGAATRGAGRRRAAARGRPATALPDGPRLTAWTSWTRWTRASTCSTPCCRRGWPGTATLWVPGWTTQPAQRALPGRSAAGPGGLPLPRSADRSREPTWPTCSGPNELLAYRLATCHNLTFTLDFMAGIRAAHRRRDVPPAGPR